MSSFNFAQIFVREISFQLSRWYVQLSSLYLSTALLLEGNWTKREKLRKEYHVGVPTPNFDPLSLLQGKKSQEESENAFHTQLTELMGGQ